MIRQQPIRVRTIEGPQRDMESVSAVHPGAAEVQLAKLEEQLGLLKAQVRQAQQLASLGTAATTIAHEVNNLLTPIQSYAQAALNGNDDSLRVKALEVTLKGVKMLVGMADRVLAISAAKPAAREAVSVRTTAQEASASLCRDLQKDGIVFVVEADDALEVWADPLQLQQVFFNLFLNARGAMVAAHGGRLVVRGRREGDRVVIDVSDTGPGIAADLVDHIFDPLQSSKSKDPKRVQRCCGLGLALCRDLIEENAGTITVSSEPGAGTTFTIALPTHGSS